MKLLNKIINLYWHIIAPPKKYANHIGVVYGKNCLIATKSWGTEPYLIRIGNNVQVTKGVRFFTHGGGHVIRSQVADFDVFGKILVKDWAYIGSDSLIMPGVTIGEGSLVAAGSVVTKSVPDRVVVGGNPARVLCSIEDYIKKNEPFNVHSYGYSPQKKKDYLLKLPEDRFLKK